MSNLQAWLARGSHVDTGEGQLFHVEAGSGEPLVLIHGFPTSSWDWHQVFDTLAQRYRVIAFDKLGYGFSDKPLDGDYTIAAHLRRTQRLLQSLGVREARVLAHDNGNTVAQAWLARQIEAPESLAVHMTQLCFLNGGLFPEMHRPRLMQKLLLTPLGPLLTRVTRAGTFGRSLAAVFGPETRPTPADLADYWTLLSRNQGQRLLHKHIHYIRERQTNRARWVGALTQSPVPIALIDGVLDPVSGAHMVAHFRRLLPDLPVVELPCGHFPQVEMPREVLQALERLWP